MRKKKGSIEGPCHRRTVSAPYDITVGISIQYDAETRKYVNVPAELTPLLPSELVQSVSNTEVSSDLLPCNSGRRKGKVHKASFAGRPHVHFDPPRKSSNDAMFHVMAATSHTDSSKIITSDEIDTFASDTRFQKTSPRDFLRHISKLHDGDYSITYRAVMNGVDVILKEMKLKTRTKPYIMNEVSAMTALQSKYLVKMYSAHVVKSTASVVLEFMNGGSLEAVAEHCKCSEEQIAYFAKKVLKGMSFMHRMHKIHRDLKSANVFLNLDGAVKIGDFGFTVDSDDVDTEQDRDLVGTFYWMAPEVIKDECYSSASDVWALGVICRELADGQPPYASFPPNRACAMIRQHGLPPLTLKRSPELVDFLEKCNAMIPGARESADELLRHPFVQRACKKADVVPLIARAKEIAERDIFTMSM